MQIGDGSCKGNYACLNVGRKGDVKVGNNSCVYEASTSHGNAACYEVGLDNIQYNNPLVIGDNLW